MSPTISLCAVILAAGESSRMGRDKALLPWPPSAAGSASTPTILSAVIQALSPFSDMVIVVAGKNEANLAPVVYAQGASLVHNPAPERGQFSSLQVGLQAVLNHGRDAALVTLVDRPPAKSATLNALCNALQQAPSTTWSVVPEHNGKHGHPFLVKREMIEAFLRTPATATARDVEHQNQQHIEYLKVDDRFVTMNLDTPQDYAALSSAASSSS